MLQAFRPEDAEGEAYVLLPKLVQTLMVMSNLDVQPRLLSATSEQLERLQRIIGCEPSILLVSYQENILDPLLQIATTDVSAPPDSLISSKIWLLSKFDFGRNMFD